MNKKSGKSSKRLSKLFVKYHVPIAVVALIECLLLLAFTTYSWIESSSTLIIRNGPQNIVEDNVVNIDIMDQTNYLFTVKADGDLADLNNYFKAVKYYELSKCTSADGKTFFFPFRNNTFTTSDKFRKGDTTDYNTSYYYLDFVIKNNSNSRKDFFFDTENIFTVTDDTESAELQQTYSVTVGGETHTGTRLDALKRAMRVSVAIGSNNPLIYSPEGSTGYNSIAGSVTNATDSSIVTPVTTRKFYDYTYREDEHGVIVDDIDPLFSANSGGAETRVSVRIWFDVLDPDFQAAFGFNSDLFSMIPRAKISVDLGMKCTDNDRQTVYFEDYTFSNTANCERLTDERQNYFMWFCAYQPYNEDPPHKAGWEWKKMTKDATVSVHNSWTTSEATITMMGALSSNLSKSYFIYAPDNGAGAPNTGAAGTYKWDLPAAPTAEGHYVFNAYSAVSYTSSSSETKTNYGVGVWETATDSNDMELVYVRDWATCVTDQDFNRSASSKPNQQYMTQKALSDPTKNILYVNNVNNNTKANNFTNAACRVTAAMHYDEDLELFKSYVPKSWLANTSTVYFNYCPNGTFSFANTVQRWSAFSPSKLLNGDDYIYTALGYVGNVLPNYYSGTDYAAGVGTWGDFEEIQLSTELIDSDHKAAYRYYIGIVGYSADSSNFNYYAMIPDATGTVLKARIPEGVGVSSAGVNFIRYREYNQINSSYVNARWNGNTRGIESTFYPVLVNAAVDNDDYDRGYWKVSVLVDGTYENLIYDTLTDGDDQGMLQYSRANGDWVTVATDGDGTANPVLNNCIDRYRFYAPAEGRYSVTWRWTPYEGGSYTLSGTTHAYDATSFDYIHDTSTGSYLLVTEARNAVPGGS